MVSTAEGILCTELDMARVREVLINFSQDPEAVNNLRYALEMLQQEKAKYTEEKEEQERERKRKQREEELERSKKDKGKGKVDEGVPSDGKSSSPPLPSQQPTPHVQLSQPRRVVDLPAIHERIMSWNARIEVQTAEWLGKDAKATFEAQQQEDIKQAKIARQCNEELLEEVKGLTEKPPEEKETMQTHIQSNLQEINHNLNQRRELRNTIQTQANTLAYQSGEYRMWIDLLDETGKEYDKVNAQNLEMKEQLEEKDKALTTNKALVKEYQTTNQQLTEFLHLATLRATNAEEQAQILAAHINSKSGLTGVATTGSEIPDSILQQELNAVKAQLQKEREENTALMGIREAKMKEINALKQELEELKRGQHPITPPMPSPPREPSPLRERQDEPERRSETQATTSADPIPAASLKTYTPIQDYQWLITKDFFSDLQERARNMYIYKREIFELSRLIPKEQFPRDSLQMDSARLRAKIEKDWADYEFQNPEQTRAGYNKPKTMYDKSLWDNQPAWRTKWMKKRSGTMKIYYESPREMRIDPTYCPTERRYTWAQFEKEQEKNPNLLNFPKVASPQSYLEINDEWMAELCETVINYYEGVPDFTIVMFCKFLRLIHILLTCF